MKADRPTAAVILAGGAGTRLWPLSRSATPKHLLPLLGDRTLLRATFERARLVAERVLVVTEQSQLEACRRELPELSDADWIAEPGRRGTAACLALAASSLPPDGVMLSLHADHLIPDEEAFATTARAALGLVAASGSLGTIGVRPTSPSTGFGYIRLGQPVPLPATPGGRAFRALGFVEKPPLEEAERMVAAGDHLWNTGIFAWPNATFLAELARHAPEIHAAAIAAAAARSAGDAAEYARRYLEAPEMAVDHAVMERTSALLVVEAGFAWSDVGSWADLAAVLPGDDAGNVVLGEGVVLDSRRNLVSTLAAAGGGPAPLVALVGVDDLVVVATGDAVLVLPRDRAQDVKRAVEQVRSRGRADLL